MNSILQCLSNTEFLVKELISIDRRVTFNYHSKTKGRVAQEVITAFRNLWSGSIRVYTIKDLKVTFTFFIESKIVEFFSVIIVK